MNAMPSTEWTVQPTERAKYDKLFDSLEPANGLLQGNKVFSKTCVSSSSIVFRFNY